jgi:uncharacterized protein (UPF0276 family)
MLAPSVGGSFRRSIQSSLAPYAKRWPVCEIVPEAWDPESATDVSTITDLARSTRLYLHSLSLNVLGDRPAEFALSRTRFWANLIQTDLVSDHFSWSSAGEFHPGLFFPPILSTTKVISERIISRQEALGLKLALENIAIASTDAHFTLWYHDLLAAICCELSLPVLVDVENLVLDARCSNLPLESLFSRYAQLQIIGYHIAGGTTVDGHEVDSHSGPPDPQALTLLRTFFERGYCAPVFFERDYAIDADCIHRAVDEVTEYLMGQGR